eukprot:1449214-Prymnesium_polylepis.1
MVCVCVSNQRRSGAAYCESTAWLGASAARRSLKRDESSRRALGRSTSKSSCERHSGSSLVVDCSLMMPWYGLARQNAIRTSSSTN